MLEHQFYYRLILIVILGTCLVSTMISFAKHNSVEEMPKKRIGLKFLGALFLALAVLIGTLSIIVLVNLTYPTEMIGPYIHRNMIVRHTSVPLIWGYTTTEQESVISAINCFFMFLSLAAYLFCFRKSPSACWKKLLKVFYVILLFTFFCSSTNFHFFDIYEWSAGVAFVVMLVGLRWRMEYGIKDKKKEEKNKKEIIDVEL